MSHSHEVLESHHNISDRKPTSQILTSSIKMQTQAKAYCQVMVEISSVDEISVLQPDCGGDSVIQQQTANNKERTSQWSRLTSSIGYQSKYKALANDLKKTFPDLEITYKALANDLKKTFPDLEITGAGGRTSSFEVTVDGEVVWSKLGGQGFPKPADIITALKNKGL
ncbi:hypothetical protein PROFUN_07556 [Planoprotostelium fungivorum]|uniref:Selenoprotein W n=1 Tax=Planoprotostelium fungivorum TaxID=1890364 RepID=A0A2P6NLU5_9EUKA|nr:hypothetical protein PROFUN_07556 [Planoprotostelium fungivorum]